MSALRLTRPRIPESAIQLQIVEGLRWKGFIVLETGNGRKRVRCPGCGSWHWPAGWQGNTPGTPDLLVSRKEWPVGMWLALEVKGEKTPVRPEQQELSDLGRIHIVRSFEEALESVEAEI